MICKSFAYMLSYLVLTGRDYFFPILKWRHREVKRKARGSRAVSSENKIYGELLRTSVLFFFFFLHINMDTAYLKSQELQFWRQIWVP